MFKKFKEFVSLKEAMAPQMGQPGQMTPQTPNPAAKMNVQNTLKQAMNVPPPTGINQSIYKNKLMAAMKMSQTSNVQTPQQAIDLVNIQQRAAQA
jgi:hypothetical protein